MLECSMAQMVPATLSHAPPTQPHALPRSPPCEQIFLGPKYRLQLVADVCVVVLKIPLLVPCRTVALSRLCRGTFKRKSSGLARDGVWNRGSSPSNSTTYLPYVHTVTVQPFDYECLLAPAYSYKISPLNALIAFRIYFRRRVSMEIPISPHT